MSLNSELLKKIKALSEASNLVEKTRNEKYPNGQEINFDVDRTEDADNLAQKSFDVSPSPVHNLLANFSRDELITTMALLWFGRGDGVAGQGATFDDVLEFAKAEADEMMAEYIGGKAPLGSYLEKGLTRLGDQ